MMRKPGSMIGVAGIATALAALLFSMQAAALGLGAIQVKSGLGQQFSAVIPLRVDSPSDLDGLTVALADPAAFRQAGVISTSAVSMLHFKVQKLDGGGAEVLVSSAQAIRDPFVNFLVSVNWNGGTLLRQYTVLLNPPDYHGAGASTAAASGAPTAQPSPVPQSAAASAMPVAPVREARRNMRHAAPAASTAPRTPAATNGTKAGAGGHYGPVAPGQTLWSIGEQVRPDPSITMDQVLLSIYDANPRAFSHGRFDGLIKGSTLRVPSAEQMRSVSVAAAADRVTRLRAAVGESPVRTARAQRVAPVERHAAQGPEAAEPKAAAAAPSAAPAEAPASKPEAGHATPAEDLGALVGGEGNATHGGAAAAPEGGSGAAGVAAAPSPAAAGAAGEAPATAVATATPEHAGAASASSVPGTAVPATAQSVVAPAAAANETNAEKAKPAEAQRPAQPAHKNPAHVIPKAPASSPSFPINWRILAIIVILLLLLAALVIRNRRRKGGGDAGPEAPVDSPKQRGRWMHRGKRGDTEQSAGPAEVELPAAGALAGAAVEPAVDADMAAAPHVDTAPVVEAGRPVEAPVDKLTGNSSASDEDSKDALADAEFHLAYGLYDGAIPLLKQAIAQHPDRPDLKLRLADACFSAGNASEFESAAGALRDSVDDAAWRKLAAKGRRLCPDSRLFQGVPPPSDADAPTMDTPDWAIPMEAPESDERVAPAETSDRGAVATIADRTLGASEAALIERGAPHADAPEAQSLTGAGAYAEPDVTLSAPGGAVAATGQVEDHLIEFDAEPVASPVGERETVASPGDAPSQQAHAPSVEAGDDRVSDIFDVTGFDAPAESAATLQAREASQKLDLGPIKFNLGEEETAGVRRPAGVAGVASAVPAEPVAAAPRSADGQGDAVRDEASDESSAYASKLELARVYATMGDGEGAREVLQEVLEHGTATEKAAADQVLQSIAGQS